MHVYCRTYYWLVLNYFIVYRHLNENMKDNSPLTDLNSTFKLLQHIIILHGKKVCKTLGLKSTVIVALD